MAEREERHFAFTINIGLKVDDLSQKTFETEAFLELLELVLRYRVGVLVEHDYAWGQRYNRLDPELKTAIIFELIINELTQPSTIHHASELALEATSLDIDFQVVSVEGEISKAYKLPR